MNLLTLKSQTKKYQWRKLEITTTLSRWQNTRNKAPTPPHSRGDICSPFLGGGSLELVLAEDRKVYAYDAFYPLYNFWHSLLNDKEQLVKDVRSLHPLDKGGFKAARDLLLAYRSNLPLSPVAAAAYFAINRSSFSGATLSGGFSQQAADGRFNENSIKRLENFEAPNLKVGFLSFEESIALHEKSSYTWTLHTFWKPRASYMERMEICMKV